MNQSLPEKVVDYIGITSAAMEKAAVAQAAQEKQLEKVAALIPAAVEALVQHERINPTQKQAMADALRDPVKALEVIVKLAGHRNKEELSQLGQPVGGTTKAASHDTSRSLSSPFVGQRGGDQIKESDARLFRGLGLPVPTA